MTSIPHLLLKSIQLYPDKTAIQYIKNDWIESYSYKELGTKVKNLLYNLSGLGLKTGDKIAILSDNRPEWTISDFAVLSLGGIIVPISPLLPLDQIEYLLKDSDSKALLLENQEEYDKINKIHSTLPSLKHIISFEKVEPENTGVILFADLLEDITDSDKSMDQSLQAIDAIKTDDVCSILYSSDSNSKPNGAMLHHQGFIQIIMQTQSRLKISSEDVVQSDLPLSQLNGRIIGQWCPLYKGATIYFTQNRSTVLGSKNKLKPSLIIALPNLIDKIAGDLRENINLESHLRKKFYTWALTTGLHYHERKNAGGANILLKIKYNVANYIALKKMKNTISDQLRLLVSGGCSLSDDNLKFFEAIHLQISECYGFNETHGPISISTPGKIKFGSPGKPLEGIEVRINAEGEILVRGETIMEGYLNKPESTWDVIDDKGWFYTGDIGHIDDDSYLFVTDRKKNVNQKS